MRKINLGSFLSMLLPLLCFAQDALSSETSNHGYVERLPLYTISEINQSRLPQGKYNTEGYVIAISICPPCPERAHCETCLIDHLLVSESAAHSTLTNSEIGTTEIVLFSTDLATYRIGKRYGFSVQILGVCRYDARYMTSYSNGIQVIGYKELP